MSNVINLSSHSTRCVECRHNIDCPMHDADAQGAARMQPNKIRVLHAGDHLYRAGDAVDVLFRIRTGVVKTTRAGRNGDAQVTGFFGAGDWVGIDALSAKVHRSDATVLNTASVCMVPVSAIHERLASSTRASRKLLDIVSQHLARKEDIQLSLARDSAAQRMAAFLLDLSKSQGNASVAAEIIALPMSRGEIASYLALAVETVSRLLTQMQRRGVLDVRRHELRIVDRNALTALCGRKNLGVDTVGANSAHESL